jgi:hypothetical protein
MRLLKKSCLLVLGFAMLVLARPMSVSAATPDPVLEWVGIMTPSCGGQGMVSLQRQAK